MSRYALLLSIALSGNFVLGQDNATQPTEVEDAPMRDGSYPQGRLTQSDYVASQLTNSLSEISAKLAVLSQKIDTIEQEQAKDKQVNLKLCDGTFLSRSSVPPCTTGASMGAGKEVASSVQEKKNCNSPDCQIAYVPARRVSTTWVTSHKKVTIKQPTPYVAVSTEWDPIACCNRSIYVTKFREEEREVLVPYKKEMICEEVGLEKIQVCLAD